MPQQRLKNEVRSASAAAFEPFRTTGDERSSRQAVNHETHVVRAGGAVVPVELTDFNADGCCVDCPTYLWRGENVSLHLPWRGAVQATVRWCREGKAGLAFAELPETRTERVARDGLRIDTSADVTFRRVGKSRFKVAVHDLSLRGCKVEIVERPAASEAVQVKFDGLDTLDGQVRWVEANEAGIEFDNPIHPAVFDMLAARFAG